MTVRVVVAEDQALVRAGLVSILGTDPGIEVLPAGTASGQRTEGRMGVAGTTLLIPVACGLVRSVEQNIHEIGQLP